DADEGDRSSPLRGAIRSARSHRTSNPAREERPVIDLDPFATATELLAALRAGRVASLELTDLYIRRIERHDPRLNAVVVRDFERARHQARAADRAAARGEPGALLGLPMTIKESYNVIGLPTTCGVPEWRNFISQHDAAAVARTREAGAVLLGKTNV